MTIQQLSQEIGIGIDTLRVWEKRYGFPVPTRNARGHREYSHQQLEELRVVKNLQGFGQRPGKIFSFSTTERRQLLEQLLAQHSPQDEWLQELVDKLSPQQIEQELSEQCRKLGLTDFVLSCAVPLLQLLDHRWTTGQISIAREHLISDQLEKLLKTKIATPASESQLKILLLTLSGERHKLGLLLAAALFHSHGVNCTWLNEELPASELPELTRELKVDAVALSFSSHYSSRQAKQNLSVLRKSVAAEIKIIAGGHAVRKMTSLPNLLICTDLAQIEPLVQKHFSRTGNG